jgi:hypothetical protein
LRRLMAFRDFTKEPFGSGKASSNRATMRTTLGIQWLRVAKTFVSQDKEWWPKPGVSITLRFRWERRFVLYSRMDVVPSKAETGVIRRFPNSVLIWWRWMSLAWCWVIYKKTENLLQYCCGFAGIGWTKQKDVCIFGAVGMSWIWALQKSSDRRFWSGSWRRPIPFREMKE